MQRAQRRQQKRKMNGLFILSELPGDPSAGSRLNWLLLGKHQSSHDHFLYLTVLLHLQNSK
jgi:hypothetical protein